jgi:demethylmenaquinone methyltransferase / 2-methoxy-6-polyprenyl-1,4-benzoquinol methylase
MFAAVAPRYDFLNHFLSLGRDIAWRRSTARALADALGQPGSLALDVCCGTGDLALALAQVASGAVMATDFCHPMLERASAKAKATRHAPFFLEADTLTLPFPDDSFDVVASAFGFRNLANYARGLSEMRRVLKRGGRVAVLEFSRLRWPVVGPLFRFYFRRVLPRLGALVSGVEGPYQYLPDSVAQFPDQDALASRMREAGFAKVCYRNFSGGIAALHLGQKL